MSLLAALDRAGARAPTSDGTTWMADADDRLRVGTPPEGYAWHADARPPGCLPSKASQPEIPRRGEGVSAEAIEAPNLGTADFKASGERGRIIVVKRTAGILAPLGPGIEDLQALGSAPIRKASP